MADDTAAVTSMLLEMPEYAESFEKRELSVLADNLRQVVKDPDNCDVCFVCGDGGRVHASRFLLVARSAVLRKMLTNGMVETTLAEIPLPGVTTTAMLAVVEFLSTGSLVHNKLTLQSAFETLAAAQFLMLDRLGGYVTVLLGHAMHEISDPERLTWCLTQLASLNSKEKPVLGDLISADMIRVVATKLYSHGLETLPTQAFNFYLDAMVENENLRTISFKEYLKLRFVLLWACHNACPEAEPALRACLPDANYFIQEGGFKHLKTCHQYSASEVDLSSLSPSVIQRLHKCVADLDSGWSSVKLHRIHPDILAKVLYPRGLIPCPLYAEALTQQVLHREDMSVMKWHLSGKETDCEVYEGGLVLHATNPTPGLQVTSNMAINYGLVEWDMEVTGPCGLLYVGICESIYCRPAKHGMHDGKPWRGYFSSTGWAFCGDDDEVGHKLSSAFGKPANSRVRFHVDMRHRTCSVTVDGKKHADIWYDLPQEVYPFVDLYGPCTIRIRLVTDADHV